MATWKRGHRIHKPGKRVTQLGATFVLGPGDARALQPRRRRQHRPRVGARDSRRGRGLSARAARCKRSSSTSTARSPRPPTGVRRGRRWSPSVGYELPDEVRDRWWNDGIDGTEHDEHSQSRDHYVAWQQARIRGMLDECGVPPDDAGRAHRARPRDRRAPPHARLRRGHGACSPSSDAAGSRSRSAPTGTGTSPRRSKPPGSTGTVDIVISSAWVGARKPHRRIYDAVLDQVGVAIRNRWSSSATRGRATWKVRARWASGPCTCAGRTSAPDATAPDDHHDQDVHRVHRSPRGARPAQLTARSWPFQKGARRSFFSTFSAPESGSGSVRISTDFGTL